MPYECIKKLILRTLRQSTVPEDFQHGINTVKWVKILRPDADDLMKIAALAHDIERAIPEMKVHRADFADFDEFKKAHAENSARILAGMMRECGWDKSSTAAVAKMVQLHETGGDEDSDVLRDADALSFFETNLPYYFKRHDIKEVERRCRWGYSRISPQHRHFLNLMEYDEPRLAQLIGSMVKKDARSLWNLQ